MSITALFIHEYLILPLFAGVVVMGGLVRYVALDKEDIWRVSPLLDISLFRALRKGRDYPRAFLHSFFFGSILLAEFLRQSLGDFFPGNIFKLDDDWPLTAALYATTVFAVTLPLKVWNNTRTEVKLEEQERLLMKARLEALTSQINPHFLFNTLNSVSSLIRTDPQQARVVVLKLSRILRRRLRNHDN